MRRVCRILATRLANLSTHCKALPKPLPARRRGFARSEPEASRGQSTDSAISPGERHAPAVLSSGPTMPPAVPTFWHEVKQRPLWISRSRIIGRRNRISGNASVIVAEIRRDVGCNREISKEPPAVGDFDQAGAVVTEGVADSGAELIGSLDPLARDVEGGCEREEVRVGQIDIDIAALEDVLLDVLDGPVGGVVVNQGDEGQTMPNGRGEFLGGHQEAAVAADRDDVPAR